MLDFFKLFDSGRLIGTCIPDLFEGAFDQLLPLLADVVIDGAHRLDRAGGWTGEGELAVDHLALVQREGSISKNHKAAVLEFTGFVFVEIEDYFFVREMVFGDFHLFYESVAGPVGRK